MPLVRYRNDARLRELIEIHRQLGVRVYDPHVYTLADGKHAGHLDPAIIQAQQDFDPQGLLNPGKMAS
ncbi:hypothetical protein [Acinetobacter sp. WZC-1]|uniref:hypothetical protein n=1 Tax=Acinetobacter sp. WZC-1 TaxID=3459034 RepID=UPI00403DC02E